MELYKKKYRIESTRLKDWDYSSSSYYFVTICTKNREYYFGNIINCEIKLSSLGNIALRYWQEIPAHFPNVKLDAYIIMPNHVHGVIIIEDNIVVETQNFASLRIHPNKFGPQSKNLASIIRGYKIGVKKWSALNKIPFAWQPRFYEHIIRTEKDLNDIREYIIYNPLTWDKDGENKDNLI